MRRNHWLVLALALVFGMTGAAQAQMKIGYIDSQKILDEYKPYQEALKEYNRYEEELSREINVRQNELVKMRENYERQSLLLSEKRKQEEQQAIVKKQQELERYVQEATDPQRGRLAQKTAELSEPIIRKVNEIITQVAEDNGYDFVLNTAALAYAKDVHDLTARVLEALVKDAGASQGTVGQ